MSKPTWEAAAAALQMASSSSSSSSSGGGNVAGVLVFVPSASQAQTTAIDMVTHSMSDHLRGRVLGAGGNGEGSSTGSSTGSLTGSSTADPNAMEMEEAVGGGGEDAAGDTSSSSSSSNALSALLQNLNKENDETLLELVGHGVGYVHPSQAQRTRDLLVQALRSNSIQILVATPSLAWELDVRGATTTSPPTTFSLSVVVRSCERWSSEESRHVTYPTSLLAQMVGHAGVVVAGAGAVAGAGGAVPSPNVTVLCHDQARRRITAAITGSTSGAYNVGDSSVQNESTTSQRTSSVIPTVESQIDTSLHDELLALVTTGAVDSRQDALDYLTWTFMYRRLPR